jgi:hypothetical protein
MNRKVHQDRAGQPMNRIEQPLRPVSRFANPPSRIRRHRLEGSHRHRTGIIQDASGRVE